MGVHGWISRRWLHFLLVILGLLALVVAIIAVLVVATILIYALAAIAFGVPVRAFIDGLPVSQVTADMAEDPFVWIAGILLFIVLLPLVARYNDWLNRVLYERSPNGEGVC